MAKIKGLLRGFISSMGNIFHKTWFKITFRVLVVLFIVSAIVTQGFTYMPRLGGVKNYPATKKAMEFLSSQIDQAKQMGQLDPTVQIELANAKIQNGVIVLTVKIGGQDLDAYITKDGSLFFPQAFNLNPQVEKFSVKKTDVVDVKLFTMSYCPFGNEAETAIIPVAKLLNGYVDIIPHYVIYSQYPSPELYSEYCLDKEAKYCSMHGIQELKQDVRELCIWKYQKNLYWDFISQVNSMCTVDNINTCWKPIATNLKIDTNKIETCEKEEASVLLDTEVQLNNTLQVAGSPMLFINETEYTGSRTPEAYKNAICDAFTKSKRPKVCDTKLSADVGQVSGSCK